MDLYHVLKPVFTCETMTSAIRQAGLVRQSHLAASLRKSPESPAFGLSVIKAQHRFLEAMCTAFEENDVTEEVYNAIGFHSFMFFGINPRIYEIAILAVSGSEVYSLERLHELLAETADIDAIIRGEENPIDTLRWMNHLGNSFATYLVKCKD